ncbi:zona pellucida-like domain protein [Dictyocaulus viviparus]|uniref:Zona pellucida-like domain protein n=1 Tax=Dictyocaulus viviparus TaxID=29172 RepID=A0A0D8Y8T2_DICVI|nr:zona pellucida-like domain protein [Dictyocaulus viviparus]
MHLVLADDVLNANKNQSLFLNDCQQTRLWGITTGRNRYKLVPEQYPVNPLLYRVDCAADAIYVKVKTNRTFEGHVQVKFAANKFCYQVLVTNNQIEVLVPHEECALPRRRIQSPAGVFLEATISVSFDPDFTTADDRIFHLQCFHQRTSKGKLHGPGSPTEPPSDHRLTPLCSYTVRKWLNGPLVGTVMLGQAVFHQWNCENHQNSCLVVHSCSVIGGETKHELMGANGCSKNTKIFPNLAYINPSLVGQNVSVFGLLQTPLIYFECKLLLIPKVDGFCKTPECAEPTNRTRRSSEAYEEDMSVDVHSQRIEVSELGGNSNVEENVSQGSKSSYRVETYQSRSQICVSINPFITALVISMIALAVFLAVILSLRRYRRYAISQSMCQPSY